jgi:PAS domain S-box-containing protein
MARLSQYVGSIYFLVGLVRSLQETIARGTTLPKYLKDIFRSYVEEQVRIGTQELKTLNARLLDEIAERMRIEEELRSINEFVLKTSRMHGVDNLCQAAAQVAQATNPESYVVVTFHDPDLGGLRVRAVEGLGDRIGELANILNAEPSSIWGSVSSMGDQAKAVAALFTSDSMEEIPGGFVTLCDGMIPADTCRAISEAFAIEKVYVAGLSLGDQLMGGLAVILHKGAELRQRTAIETIASHLAVLLDRSLGELTLHESEARFRALWKHSIVGSLLTAPDGRVFAANPAACRLFGRTEEDIRAIGRAGLVDFADRRVFVLLSERAEKGYASGEMTFVRADGTRFPALCSSAVFETADGSRTCMVIQDISEMKQAEKRVRVFSRQLLSVQEEEKRRLSAVLHHDVGSISVGLTARLLAAEEDLREGKSEQALASIRECRRIFAQAVKRLKALAVDLRPPDLDLLGLTAALRQHFLELSRVSPLRIHFTDAAGGAEIGPEAQTILFRAAQECLNNVIEHAEAQWVRVRLSVTRRLIRLTITDGGKGFNSDRLAGKTDRHLGLHAMQEMAASLGGEVVVESAKGQGTTIRVNLPREERSA